MNPVLRVRQEFGGVYVTIFSDDLIVPWKPLCLRDYIEYQESLSAGFISESILHDEIFKKCVVDKTLIRQFNTLPAGIVTSVAYCILQFSGPTESVLSDLETARDKYNSPLYRNFSDLIHLITLAFPYTPHQLMKLQYEDFLMLTLMAEEKALRLGLIKEPIQTKGKKKNFLRSPVLEVPPTHGIDFQAEQKVEKLLLDNHEKADWVGTKTRIDKQKEEMVRQARELYKDIIK